MRLVKPKNHTVSDIYKAWCRQQLASNPDLILCHDYCCEKKDIKVLTHKETKEVIMTYSLFRKVIEMFNTYAGEALIEGEFIQLHKRLGYLHGRRIERNFTNPKVDVISTVQARKTDPTHPAIYHLDEDYCRIGWQKSHLTKNESVYDFVPASHSLRAKFSATLKSNPILKFNYTYYPLLKSKSA